MRGAQETALLNCAVAGVRLPKKSEAGRAGNIAARPVRALAGREHVGSFMEMMMAQLDGSRVCGRCRLVSNDPAGSDRCSSQLGG
jgi:hypothetical protein